MVNLKYLCILGVFLASGLHAEPTHQIDQAIVDGSLSDAETNETTEDESTPLDDDALELELAQIRLVLEQKKYSEGLSRLETLAKEHPDNLEIIQMKASTEAQLNRWSDAFKTLDDAEKRFPNNEDLKGVREDILDSQKEHREYIAIEGEYRKTGSTRKEYFGFLKGKVRIATFTFLGLDAQHDTIYAKEITRPKTGATVTEREHRQKANVFVEHLFDNGHTAKAGVYGAQSVFGGHASFTFIDSMGSTTLEGKLRRPDWDYSETVIFGGSRDTVSIMRVLNLTENLQLEAEGGFNNYNLDCIDNIAQSIHVIAKLAYTFFSAEGFEFIPGRNTGITLSYIFDSEYPYRRQNRIGPDGGYPTLAIERAENHGLELYISTLLTPELEAAIFGGYSVTRFAMNIPFGGVNLDYTIMKKVQLGLEYEHTIDGANRGESVDRVKAKLKYLFD